MKTQKFLIISCIVAVAVTSFAQKGELAFTSSSEEAKKLLRQAWVSLGDLKFDEANQLVAQAIEKDPDFGMAYFSRFTADTVERKRNLEKALGAKLSADEKMFLDGVRANRNKQSPKQFFDPLLKKYSKDNYLALWILFSQPTAKERIEVGESLVKRSPRFPPAYNLLGYAYMDEKNMAKAEANFDKYMSLRPDLANPYDSKADYLMRLSKFQEASELYEKAAALGMTQSKLRAQRAMGRAKYLRPSDEEFNKMKNLVTTATAELSKGNVDGLISQHSEQAVEIFGNQMTNVGAANIKARLTDMITNNQFAGNVNLTYVDGLAPIAVGYGSFESVVTPRNGSKAAESKGNAVFIFHKLADGWKILAVHFVPGEQSEAADDVVKVRQVINMWSSFVKPGDVISEEHFDALAKLYSPQAIEIYTNRRTNVGIANIRARWSNFLGRKVEANSLGAVDVKVVGRRAVAWGMGIQNSYPKDSQELSKSTFPWAMIFTKEKDDVWRILAVHWFIE